MQLSVNFDHATNRQNNSTTPKPRLTKLIRRVDTVYTSSEIGLDHAGSMVFGGPSQSGMVRFTSVPVVFTLALESNWFDPARSEVLV